MRGRIPLASLADLIGRELVLRGREGFARGLPSEGLHKARKAVIAGVRCTRAPITESYFSRDRLLRERGLHVGRRRLRICGMQHAASR